MNAAVKTTQKRCCPECGQFISDEPNAKFERVEGPGYWDAEQSIFVVTKETKVTPMFECWFCNNCKLPFDETELV